MNGYLSRHATADDEAELLEATRGMTVAAAKRCLRERAAAERQRQGSADPSDPEADEPRYVTLELKMPREHALALEAMRLAAEHLNHGRGDSGEWLESLLAEGCSTLTEFPGGNVDLPQEIADRFEAFERARKAREAAEVLLEEAAEPIAAPPFEPLPQEEDELPRRRVELDRRIRDLSAELASREHWFGRLLARFFAIRGWATLGYATEQQYCVDRLGMARATVRSRITLAKRVRWLEPLEIAIQQGALGHSQASLIAKVASPDTVDAWIDRAKARTFKHLQEEAWAAELIARSEGKSPEGSLPPTLDQLKDVQRFESQVVSGALFNKPPENDPAPNPVQISGGPTDTLELHPEGLGAPVTLRIRVRDDVAVLYRQLEALYERTGLPGTFIHFLIWSFIQAWGEALTIGNRVKHIFDRDAHRCTSPVCDSRNVTNHHVVYRSKGGPDDAWNQISLCDFCHLEGEHDGRLKVRGTANHLRWWIGREPIIQVDGRDKVVA